MQNTKMKYKDERWNIKDGTFVKWWRMFQHCEEGGDEDSCEDGDDEGGLRS